MKIEDIQPGKIYRSLNLTDAQDRYLGIGMRKLYTGDSFGGISWTEKHLVIIECPSFPDCVGRMIQEGENAGPGIWEKIVAIDDPDYKGMFIAQLPQNLSL